MTSSDREKRGAMGQKFLAISIITLVRFDLEWPNSARIKPFHFIQMLLPTGILPFALSLQAVLSFASYGSQKHCFCCKKKGQLNCDKILPIMHWNSLFFRWKIKKFSGEGAQPPPPVGRGTPPLHTPPLGASILAPTARGPRRLRRLVLPPSSEILDPPLL